MNLADISIRQWREHKNNQNKLSEIITITKHNKNQTTNFYLQQ